MKRKIVLCFNLLRFEVLFQMKKRVYVLTVSRTPHTAAAGHTTCHKGFFGGITRTHSIIASIISFEECNGAVHKYKTFGQEATGFPSEQCSWLSTDTEKNTVVTVTPHDVTVDSMNGNYVDATFPGGICKTSPCVTIHNVASWVSDQNKTQVCLDSDLHIMSFNFAFPFETSQLARMNFWSEDLMAKTMMGCCQTSYCNKPGILWTTGEWIHFLDLEIGLDELIKEIPICNQSVHEVQITRQGLIDINTIDKYMKLQHHKCETARARILAGESISRLDLQLFTPSKPGFSPVYRYNNGLVEVLMISMMMKYQ